MQFVPVLLQERLDGVVFFQCSGFDFDHEQRLRSDLGRFVQRNAEAHRTPGEDLFVPR